MANPTVPANVQAARDAVVDSDLYAMCHLMLASYAYAGQNTRDNAIASIQSTFETNATPANSKRTVPSNSPVSDCVWSLQWGPHASLDNSNLMYAAALIDQVSQLPIMGTIAIRGTDIAAWDLPKFQQVLQDMNVGLLESWPYTMQVDSSSAHLAAGTLSGFQNKILKLGEGFVKDDVIAKWVGNFTTTYPGTPIVVTGHSLGGCQATVLAAYLRSKESGVPHSVNICPNPFAGPTAGDAGFAAMYDSLFANSARRWVNTFDVAPMAFNIDDLEELPNFWNADQWKCDPPFTMDGKLSALLKGVTDLVQTKGYMQPDAGPRLLGGSCGYPASPSFLSQITSPTSFVEMMEMQHFPPAYQNLMSLYMTDTGNPTLIWPAPQTAQS